ncbi:2-hydroxymuconate semialdehyde hydrolase [Pigmentiphaga humi]|uniref:2-hydroxymuconate semialdehyde hydrolase n=1 Tax=Pigmentiphaga humi TaxID=2478468 RepID=A0A3P4AYN0_9BURK|nr:alpha/beta fold hydrolase [Pigmentiphaga humi]VCU68892.1 2-hydroxymuconate semialdehyde hydrolase [Pigmentiphaga humi]
MSIENPEIGRRIDVGGIQTNYHDQGSGFPVLMIHGSGPGVTGWANWRLSIPAFAQRGRVVVPDLVGFGYTDRGPVGKRLDLDSWVEHLVGLLDALDIEQADLVGNSFGGALALAVAIRHPGRVRKLVLMGSVGTSFPITPGLDAVWGYTPSLENMRAILDIFAYDRSLVSDELAELRYRASIRPGVQEAYADAFGHAPRQRHLEALASDEADIARIPHETLIIHGREDRVIPVSNSIKLSGLIPDSQLHLYPHCGHWTQIEKRDDFNRLVCDFLFRSREAGG